jgi:NADH-quinone oxidoreductase subunit C
MTQDIFSNLELLHDSRPDPQTSGIYRMVMIAQETLQPAAWELLAGGYHLEDVSALDATEGFLVTYHFDSFGRPAGSDSILRMALRVLVDHGQPHLPSIADIFSGAEWHEREISDFFGIRFDGNPNPAALLLPEADDSTPLKKAPDKRRSLKDLICPGQVVFKAPGVELWDADPQPATGTSRQPDHEQG